MGDSVTRASAPRITVGVDGSRFGAAALRWAVQEGMRRECVVEAILAWQPDSATTGTRPEFPISEDVRVWGAKILAEAVTEAAEGTGAPEPAQVLMRGWPPDVLLRASAGSVLLVLGSHGRGRLFDAGVGSVLDYCIRHAYCPVVVVPSRMAVPCELDADQV